CQPPSPGTPCFQMHSRKSNDNGVTWLADDTLSDVPSPLQVLTEPGIVPTFASDYDYASSALNKHLVGWVDGRVTINGVSQGDAFFDRELGSTTCTDDTWTATSLTNAPDGRMLPTAVWTGKEMIVWGGTTDRINGLNTGGKYNPSTDSWTPINTINAPTGRFAHTAVWTRRAMIVWGGYNNSTPLNTGRGYESTHGNSTALSTTN